MAGQHLVQSKTQGCRGRLLEATAGWSTRCKPTGTLQVGLSYPAQFKGSGYTAYRFILTLRFITEFFRIHAELDSQKTSCNVSQPNN
jgi:hypothetical protein